MPFFSEAPDPDSDVVVTLSLRTYRLVCLRCGLSKSDRTETDTCDAMSQHLDEHRVAGHRVPDSFYEGLLEAHQLDDDIRTVYAWSGRDGDNGLSVSLITSGCCLGCLCCELNESRMVECYTTEEMIQHLGEHQARALPVAEHVYEGLRRDRESNDQRIRAYFDKGGRRPPSATRWEPPNLWEFNTVPDGHQALDQLIAMVSTAISRFDEPLSSTEAEAGWNEERSRSTVRGLHALLRDIEAEAAKVEPASYRQLLKDVGVLRRALWQDPDMDLGMDQRRKVVDQIRDYILMIHTRDGIDELSTMLVSTISRFERALSSSERAAGWNEALSISVVEELRTLSHDLEAMRDELLFVQYVAFQRWWEIDRLIEGSDVTPENDDRHAMLASIGELIKTLR